jgi:hypothetical protein
MAKYFLKILQGDQLIITCSSRFGVDSDGNFDRPNLRPANQPSRVLELDSFYSGGLNECRLRQRLGGVGPEPRAGLLPLALGAPHISLLQPVNFATFFPVPGPPVRGFTRLTAVIASAVVRAARRWADHDELTRRSLQQSKRSQVSACYVITNTWALPL